MAWILIAEALVAISLTAEIAASVDQPHDAKALVVAQNLGHRDNPCVAAVVVITLAILALILALTVSAITAVTTDADFGGTGALIDRHAVIALTVGAIAPATEHAVDDRADDPAAVLVAVLLAILLAILRIAIILRRSRGGRTGDHCQAGRADHHFVKHIHSRNPKIKRQHKRWRIGSQTFLG